MPLTTSLEYARLAKIGFLLGLALYLVGSGGEFIGHAVLRGIPEWEATLLLDLEVIGRLAGFFSPVVFGIALPLLDCIVR